jgi:hypothetical protein
VSTPTRSIRETSARLPIFRDVIQSGGHASLTLPQLITATCTAGDTLALQFVFERRRLDRTNMYILGLVQPYGGLGVAIAGLRNNGEVELFEHEAGSQDDAPRYSRLMIEDYDWSEGDLEAQDAYVTKPRAARNDVLIQLCEQVSDRLFHIVTHDQEMLKATDPATAMQRLVSTQYHELR